MLVTKIDQLVDLARAQKSPTLEFAATKLDLPIKAVEAIASMLERGNVVEIRYPVNILEKPYLVFRGLPPEPAPKQEGERGKVILTYSFKADRVPATVQVSDTGREKYYTISLVELSQPTRIFLDEIKEELLRSVPAEQSDVSDVEKLAKIKSDFSRKIEKYLETYHLGPETSELLTGMLLHIMFGLGELDMLTQDDSLEEIAVINSKQPIGIYHRKFGWLKTNMYMPDEDAIFNYSSQIARRVGRQIAVLTPILDARLETGDRVNATLAPISAHGNTITIRKFAKDPWTVINLITDQSHTMTTEMAGMLWQAIHYEMNVLVAGGTASGKTSALNALLAFIPPNQRILTIEDTRELVLPSFQWNWIPMLTRNSNAEGLGEVSMLDLMVSALRMRPDRIVLGEMRRQKEAEVLFEAMHTGHSVYSTLHADTSNQVIRRLTNPPIDMPPSEIEALHLVIVQYRDRRRNLRRTLEICEMTSGAGNDELSANIIYRWRPRTDTFEKVGEPTKYYKELNLHTGMTKDEIVSDIKNRAMILSWMLKNKMYSLEAVGKVMSIYYADPKSVIELARGNLGIRKP
jgi:flagellar protein FlaI